VSRSGARSPLWRTGARTEIESVAVDLSAVSVAGLGRIFEKAQPDVVNAAAAVWRATEQSMRALHMRQHARHPAPQRLRTPVRYHRRRGDLHPRPLPGRLPASTPTTTTSSAPAASASTAATASSGAHTYSAEVMRTS
jgi:hypothetical protein